jgi:hypothetical protein
VKKIQKGCQNYNISNHQDGYSDYCIQWKQPFLSCM